ncbi:MAG: hypothetical protein GWN01_05525 [Nitrosopumilaceae archaeon]|nr:hypothetical protein [Nitrosopumilaceae archaeon]NIU86808.1 hypothetical protein [Nitrosopumilaceae archaeon]NIX61005.1 hypothetical protein [Nitrosopumilaceae archaeon]
MNPGEFQREMSNDVNGAFSLSDKIKFLKDNLPVSVIYKIKGIEYNTYSWKIILYFDSIPNELIKILIEDGLPFDFDVKTKQTITSTTHFKVIII